MAWHPLGCQILGHVFELPRKFEILGHVFDQFIM